MPIQNNSLIIYIALLVTVSLVACAPATTREIDNYEKQGNIDKLIYVAKRSDKPARIKAIRALGELKDPRAVNTLVGSLKSSSWVEREAAVIAFGQIQDYLCVKPLVNALGDEDKFVRERAAKELLLVSQHLAKEKNSRIVNILFTGLNTNHEYTREQVAVALQAAIDVFKTDYRPYFLGQLMEALNNPNRFVRREAARALGKFNDPRVVKPLLAAQKDLDTQVQIIASEALQHNDNPRSVNSLLVALGSNDASIREDAIDALKKFTRPAEISEILKTLHHNNPRVREAIVRILGTLKDPKIVQSLLPLLKDTDAAVRQTTADMLSSTGWQPESDDDKAVLCVARQHWNNCSQYADAAIKPLLLMMHDHAPEIRQNAASVLISLDWKPVTGDEKAINCVMRKNWDECVALGKIAISALVRELNTQDITTKQHIISALAKINDKSAIRPLVTALDNDDTGVRISVVNALGQFNHPLVITTLIHALDDSNYYVRQAALAALENNLDAFRKDDYFDARTPLLKALRDNNRNVRLAAAKLLGDLQDPATITPLIAAMEDQDRDVRETAGASLTKIKDSSAIEPLVAALKNKNPAVRSQILRSLSGFKDYRAIEPLLNSLQDENEGVRLIAIKIVGGIDDPRTVSPLISLLDSKSVEVKHQVIIALSHKNDPRIIEPLKKLLVHEKSIIRDAAGHALIKNNWKPLIKDEEGYYCVIKRDWPTCEALGKYAVSALLTELRDPDSNIRVECARTLGVIHDFRAITPLIESIEMTQWSGRQEDNVSLIETTKKALIKYDKDAVPELINYLTNWYTSRYIAQVLEVIGWIPKTDTQLVHYQIARRDREKLLANWELTKKVLLRDINSQDINVKNNALFALIGLGKDESVTPLLNTLAGSGSIAIAEAYLNSGNDQLKMAAISWSANHNLEVKEYSKGNNPVLWGTM